MNEQILSTLLVSYRNLIFKQSTAKIARIISRKYVCYLIVSLFLFSNLCDINIFPSVLDEDHCFLVNKHHQTENMILESERFWLYSGVDF